MAVTKQPPEPMDESRKIGAVRNKAGIDHYGAWELEKAVVAFQEAVASDPDNPEYQLNLARTYARSMQFDEALLSLGHFLRTETDEHIAERYERLFSSALDDVELLVTEKGQKLEIPLPLIGKAIQMWLEYRITIGRRLLPLPEPAPWAAALLHAVCKVNGEAIGRARIAAAHKIEEQALTAKYDELIQTLDLMPADFRYFAGEENPLDKLVEAAHLLEEMYGRFYDE